MGAFGDILGAIGVSSTNDKNVKEARRQTRFQAHMSNTAHTREVADLRAAGLNPILSATGGQGASSPQGSKADIQDFVTKGISSALEIRQLENAVKQTESQIALQDAQGSANRAAAVRDMNSAQQSGVQTQILRNQLPESKTRGQIGGIIGKGIKAFQTSGQSLGAGIGEFQGKAGISSHSTAQPIKTNNPQGEW